MKIPEPEELARLRAAIPDAGLRKKFDEAIVQLLGERVADLSDKRRMRRVAFYVPVGIFAFGTVATLVITLLATLRVIELDQTYLSLLWKLFVGEMVVLAVWIIRRIFKD
jgi:hypothetical protein